jgi:hypothetical protein
MATAASVVDFLVAMRALYAERCRLSLDAHRYRRVLKMQLLGLCRRFDVQIVEQ